MTEIAARGDVSIAVVHEWIEARAGSELVFEQLAAAFPTADLYCLTRRPNVSLDSGARTVTSTGLDRIRSVPRALQLPVMPGAWHRLKRPSYDLVVSSSHAFAREFFRPDRDGTHLSYVHSPMRYAWLPRIDGRGQNLGTIGQLGRRFLRRRDLASVAHVESFAANSSATAARIRDFYGREAEIIHPPVDVEFFGAPSASAGEPFLLAAARWIPYKRMDLAIEAAREVGMPLVVAGSGSEEGRLRQLARNRPGPPVRFEVNPTRERLRQLMQTASAFLFPAIEDFGIVAVEALAAGTPVVGVGQGGALDIVDDGVVGALSVDQSVAAFSDAVRRCLDLHVEPQVCRVHAKRFSVDEFAVSVAAWADRALQPPELSHTGPFCCGERLGRSGNSGAVDDVFRDARSNSSRSTHSEAQPPDLSARRRCRRHPAVRCVR